MEMTPVVFDKSVQIETPISDKIKKGSNNYFMQNLHLIVPIDIIRLSPGGSVAADCTEPETLIKVAKLPQKVTLLFVRKTYKSSEKTI